MAQREDRGPGKMQLERDGDLLALCIYVDDDKAGEPTVRLNMTPRAARQMAMDIEAMVSGMGQ